MTARVSIYRGTARSKRAQHIDDRLLDGLDAARLIVPTRRYARDRTTRLIDRAGLPGAFGRPILTFQDFAALILTNSDIQTAPLSSHEQRLLLENIVGGLRQSGELEVFGTATETRGFVTHVQTTIAQLKQNAIDPGTFLEMLGRRGPVHPRDAAVAAIYSSFQDALHELGLSDLQGLYWLARVECETRRPAVLDPVQTLLVDGFDSFTPSELNLLCAATEHVEELIIGLAYSTLPGRKDAYRVVIDLEKQLDDRFEGIARVDFDAEPARTFTEFAVDHLFWRDLPEPVENLDPNVSIGISRTVSGEIESVARRIKRTIRESGVPLDTFAVIHPDISAIMPVLREIFAEFGLPLRSSVAPPLEEAALARFVLGLLEALENWDREDVTDVLRSPWFGIERQSSERFELLARLAGIVSGSDEWTARLNRLQRRLKRPSGFALKSVLEKFPNLPAALEILREATARLAELDAAIPPAAPMETFTNALAGYLRDAQAPVLSAQTQSWTSQEIEGAARSAMYTLLARLECITPQRRGHTISRFDYCRILRDAFNHVTLDLPEPPHGIFVGDLESARRLRFDYVYCMGLTEKAFPKPPPANPLYSGDDAARLSNAGIQIDRRLSHADEQALLFLRTIETAKQRLVCSWSESDAAGRDALPSAFLDDLIELTAFTGCKALPEGLDAIPSFECIGSPRDLRNAMFADAAGLPWRGEFPETLPGVEAEHERYSAAPFDTYDGLVEDEAVLQNLLEQFGPEHVFSATALETYAGCPFRFLIEKIYRIDEVRPPEEGLDPRMRGTLLHQILERFHRLHAGKALPDIPHEEAQRDIERVVLSVFEERQNALAGWPDEIVEVEKNALRRRLQRYLNIERDRAEPWAPSHFEASFGRRATPDDDGLSRDEPLVLETAAGPVRLSGRIDRVDTRNGHYRVVDYKSGAVPPNKDVEEGRHLQYMVYTLALEELLDGDRTCDEALYLSPGRPKGRYEALKRNKNEFAERREIVFDAISNAVKGIRAGTFHVRRDLDSCTGCPAGKICRHERGRIQMKLADD